MPLIENNRLAYDVWSYLEADESARDRSMIIVPFARLDEVLMQWPEGHRGLGVDLPNDVQLGTLSPHLSRFDIVAVNFPSFADGRAFSQARSIRTTHRFGGTIRARGNFLPDQYGFMLQSGIDSLEVSDRFPEEVWLRQATQFPATYQRDYALTGLEVRPLVDAIAWPEQPHYG